MKILNVENLTKTFATKGNESVNAVDKISFSIEQGEKIAFIGPNGAGKSTTIKILTGILHPTSGNAKVCGFTPWTERMKMAYKIGCMFGQKSQLNMSLSVLDSYRLLGVIYDLTKKETEDRINELVEYFDIGKLVKKQTNSLSLGERMICEIVGVLLHRPQVLFLDEPTIGLDLIMKQKVREMILELNQKYGTTVILTSHDVGDVEFLCDRMIIINHGRLVLDEKIDKIKNTILTKKVLNVFFGNHIEEHREKFCEFCKILELKDNNICIEIDTKIISISDVMANLSKFGEITDIDIKSAELESIIVDNFKEARR